MYALVGEQLYAGKTDYSLGFRENFDNFLFSFLSVFQLLTITNWTDIQILTLNTDIYRGTTILYLISCIIIGNYIFLNLFIGILINGFLKESEIEMDEEETELKLLKEKSEQEEKLRLLQIQQMYSEEDIIAGLVKKKRKKIDIFEGVECRDSLFLFSKSWKIRRIIHITATSNSFENFILLAIVFSSVKLALDTYDLFGLSSNLIDLILNSLFILEALCKIISSGFIWDKGSYMRNGWNILDFSIVAISIIDMSLLNVDFSFQKVFQYFSILVKKTTISF